MLADGAVSNSGSASSSGVDETGASMSLTQENAMILVAQTKITDESYDLKPVAEEDVDRQTYQVVDKVVTKSESFVND